MFLSSQPQGVVPLTGGAVEPLAERNPVPPTFTLEESLPVPAERKKAQRTSVKEKHTARVEEKGRWERFKERMKLNARRRLQYIEAKRLANKPDQLAHSLQRIEKMSEKEVADQLSIKDGRAQVRIADTASELVITGIGAFLEKTFVGKNKGCVMGALKRDADLHTALATEMACIPLLSEGKIRLAMLAGKDITEGALKAREMPEGKVEVTDTSSLPKLPDLFREPDDDLPILPDRVFHASDDTDSKEIPRPSAALSGAPRAPKKTRRPLSEAQRK